MIVLWKDSTRDRGRARWQGVERRREEESEKMLRSVKWRDLNVTSAEFSLKQNTNCEFTS